MNNLKNLMRKAFARKILIPAFNIAYLPMLEPIVDTLRMLNTFALLEVSRPDVEKFAAKSFSAVVEEYRKVVDNNLTALHLDHIPVIDEDGQRVAWRELVQQGIDLGFDSVMIDGSRLPLEENIKVTRTVVEMAQAKAVPVEAELGAVFGHEKGPLPPYEELFQSKQGFTSVEETRRFVKEIGVDWLSVACGNIHGAISGVAKSKVKVKAKLDIAHLKRLKEASNIPLVLHGGSGIEQKFLLEAVENGITKINIGTDIRQAYEEGLGAGKENINLAQGKVAEKVRSLIEDTYSLTNSAQRLGIET